MRKYRIYENELFAAPDGDEINENIFIFGGSADERKKAAILPNVTDGSSSLVIPIRDGCEIPQIELLDLGYNIFCIKTPEELSRIDSSLLYREKTAMLVDEGFFIPVLTSLIAYRDSNAGKQKDFIHVRFIIPDAASFPGSGPQAFSPVSFLALSRLYRISFILCAQHLSDVFSSLGNDAFWDVITACAAKVCLKTDDKTANAYFGNYTYGRTVKYPFCRPKTIDGKRVDVSALAEGECAVISPFAFGGEYAVLLKQNETKEKTGSS